MAESDSKGMRLRSPNYPFLDLQAAIIKAAAFDRAVGRNKASYEAAASYLGFTPTSSSALRCVAALSAFGLLSEEGKGRDRKLWLSELGRTIVLRPEASPERVAAVRTAAVAPRLHEELWGRWGGRLPDDETVRSYLRLEMGFTDSAADHFISEFKATIEYAKLGDTAASFLESSPKGDDREEPAGQARPIQGAGEAAQKRETVLSIPLPSGGIAMLRAPAVLSPADARRIKKYVDAATEDDSPTSPTDNGTETNG